MVHEAARLLIVEDDPAAQRQLRWTFDAYEVETVGDRPSAVAACRKQDFQVILLDLGLPPDPDGFSEGLAALGEIAGVSPDSKVIVVTGREERHCALEAVRMGAYDFYEKPVDVDEISVLVDRARRMHALEVENRQLARSASREPLPGLVTANATMREICSQLARVARSDLSILLTGESGTGKELIARALHGLSDRREGPFVAINCAAIPDTLLESELFGHEKGSFTGADRRVVGQVEVANGGTLLLDEIGDMPTGLQAKLLRFLQERVIRRIGGRQEIPVDVRIVSATHQDLDGDLQSGVFREDLFYRLSELRIEVPPLRDRPEDIVILARHFLDHYGKQAGRRVRGLTPDALGVMASHRWPGNVRELESCIKRAVALCESDRVTARDLQLEVESEPEVVDLSLRAAVRAAEYDAVSRAWSQAGGVVSRASRLLGVSRPTLYKLLREHGFKE